MLDYRARDEYRNLQIIKRTIMRIKINERTLINVLLQQKLPEFNTIKQINDIKGNKFILFARNKKFQRK